MPNDDIICRYTTSSIPDPRHILDWIRKNKRRGYSVVSYNVTPIPNQNLQQVGELYICVVMDK